MPQLPIQFIQASVRTRPQADSVRTRPQADSVRTRPQADSVRTRPQADSVRTRPQVDSLEGNDAISRMAGATMGWKMAYGFMAKRFSEWLADAQEGLQRSDIFKYFLSEKSILIDFITSVHLTDNASLSCHTKWQKARAATLNLKRKISYKNKWQNYPGYSLGKQTDKIFGQRTTFPKVGHQMFSGKIQRHHQKIHWMY
ncbi:hypothetical protein BgiBS90_001552 [Biomphalaria glabrata]|nr:hypothetical protein BgiBS90_001552 [Biomphalaria glabrata]